ncbi:MAG: circularly permuted type 2 ATP-grasp protein [Chthoniobacterales bacterium]
MSWVVEIRYMVDTNFMKNAFGAADLKRLRGRVWHEVLEGRGDIQLDGISLRGVREPYKKIVKRLRSMGRVELRRAEDRLEATMREMGVTFDIERKNPWGHKPWYCDVLPQIFLAEEWEVLERVARERLAVYEMFLRDVYGNRDILRSRTIPVRVVLNSPYYQRVVPGLPRPDGAFLHLSGVCFSRQGDGRLRVKQHYFSNASGVSYMMQNRRALSRVLPSYFKSGAVCSIIEAPTKMLESLRRFSDAAEPTVVLLSPGELSPAYSEHAFLGRRMGIPVVLGKDLLVLKDVVYLKTINGLERVHVIFSRVADPWLDPLVFDPESVLGVPGLVHCIRQGSVVLANAIGSQLADDRSLLGFDDLIFRFYTGRGPEVPVLRTYWLGDLDCREMVLGDLESFVIRPVYGERLLTPGGGGTLTDYRRRKIVAEVGARPWAFVAQPVLGDALTLSFEKGRAYSSFGDHIVFARRESARRWEIFRGALTRISTRQVPYVASELGGGSKDTLVLRGEERCAEGVAEGEESQYVEPPQPALHVTSRVADAFYWMGRYLERAFSLSGMILTIENLELEELNGAERTLYRPVWNRILPRLESRETVGNRNISSWEGRHRLALDGGEPGSVAAAVLMAISNADSITEVLSVEVWGVLDELRSRFGAAKFLAGDEERGTGATRRICEAAAQLIPQFFGVAEATMLQDGGWKFCVLGQSLERACITGNALGSISGAVRAAGSEHSVEIQLSAFLRMLGCRDVYRRVFQMRIEFGEVFELLLAHPHVPRSVTSCLRKCRGLLLERGTGESSLEVSQALKEVEVLLAEIQKMKWSEVSVPRRKNGLVEKKVQGLMERIFKLHDHVLDGFINHQVQISRSEVKKN